MAADITTKTPESSQSDATVSSQPTAPPSVVPNANDPGDATMRNFRYQHSYGVILLVAAKRGLRPYVALWCEHHEDFLAQRADGLFDAYQIKTSRPEQGAWTLRDEELSRSIGRFLDLEAEFEAYTGDFFFVSNTEFDSVKVDHKDQKKRGRCPLLFLQHIHSAPSVSDISAPFTEAFAELQAGCGCTKDQLFRVLKRTNCIVGPSRADFDATLSHEHLGSVNECRSLNPSQLDEVRENLVGIVFRASSLHVTDPMRHLTPLIRDGQTSDPILAAKRIAVDQLQLRPVNAGQPSQFVFQGAPVLALGGPRPASVLEQKLSAGGLADDVDYMMERERSAEFHLLEDTNRRSDQYPTLLRQIEERVRGECQEAHLRARCEDRPFGQAMMIDVQDRLKRLASESPSTIGHHPYECLIGVAALLTSECTVWWSKRFPLQTGDVS